jgi:hypothetical protein
VGKLLPDIFLPHTPEDEVKEKKKKNMLSTHIHKHMSCPVITFR